MARVFLSYAREDAATAQNLAEFIAARGHDVWWDRHIHGGSRYVAEIDRALQKAEAVVVLWSKASCRSAWVQDEAAEGRESGRLVPVTLNSTRPPLGFRQFQSVDLSGWHGDAEAPVLNDLLAAISNTAGDAQTSDPARHEERGAGLGGRPTICVLPFANMSGDPEQEYFSDGITEDLITDLSKISALGVVARNSSFTFKGKSTEATSVARQFNVSHVLEGSVRKAGNRLRITAQLIDGRSGHHLWAERYDRELADIFDIQDDLSSAIVAALRLKLLPAERRALDQRGTSSAEAYNLYLMARQQWVSGNDGDWDREELIIRICQRALALDPNYAHAWALIAIAQSHLQFRQGKQQIDGLAAAERALALDPNLAEAHAVKARYFLEEGREEQAQAEVTTALGLDPGSWEVNKLAGKLRFLQGRLNEAAAHYEKAAELMEMDYHSAGMLLSCYSGLGDPEARRHAAEMTLDRVEKALANNPRDGAAMGHGVLSLAALGQVERARQWIDRALEAQPDNYILRHNLACALATELNDHDRALDLVEGCLTALGTDHVRHVQVDPDLRSLRENPRFQKMVADAVERLSSEARFRTDAGRDR